MLNDLLFSSRPDLDPFVRIAACLTVVLLIWVIFLTFRMRSLTKRFRQFITSSGGVDLEGLLGEYLETAREARQSALHSAELVETLAAAQRGCVQRTGVVRFDAFDDTGGRLSFSLALLDGSGDGVIVTSVYGRDGCRVYAKPLQGGACETALSAEERDAVGKALSQGASTAREIS